ncbi:MAG: hypothetical protein IJU23_07075 [Proteobacteria bacterium]|nr:hypothetical protein [Pseudomonadota bacterium]
MTSSISPGCPQNLPEEPLNSYDSGYHPNEQEALNDAPTATTPPSDVDAEPCHAPEQNGEDARPNTSDDDGERCTDCEQPGERDDNEALDDDEECPNVDDAFWNALDALPLPKDAEWLDTLDAYQNCTICYQPNNTTAISILVIGICALIFAIALFIQMQISSLLPISPWPVALIFAGSLAAIGWGAYKSFDKVWISISETHILIERGLRRKNVANAFDRDPGKTVVEMTNTSKPEDSPKFRVTLVEEDREFELARSLSREKATALTNLMNRVLEL